MADSSEQEELHTHTHGWSLARQPAHPSWQPCSSRRGQSHSSGPHWSPWEPCSPKERQEGKGGSLQVIWSSITDIPTMQQQSVDSTTPQELWPLQACELSWLPVRVLAFYLTSLWFVLGLHFLVCKLPTSINNLKEREEEGKHIYTMLSGSKL